MRRAPGAGNQRELDVMAQLKLEGWLCASRRHIAGPGDVLAFRTDEALLIEVKSTAGGPYERFGPADRRALLELARSVGAEPWLYWWPARQKLQRIPHYDWPNAERPAEE